MYFDSTELEKHFNERILKTSECWLITGYRNAKGYGKINHKGLKIYAHRYALSVKIGRDLLKDECACHTCDNPSCVNPDHLFVGSRKDNAHDAIAKGRFAFNQRKSHCKRGHKLEGDNVYRYRFGKYIHHSCRTCKAIRQKKYDGKRAA